MFQITLLAKRAARMAPNALATSYQGRNYSWSRFVERVARLAGGLRSLGVDDNDRVAIVARNSDRLLELFYAVPWAGAVFVPLNTRSSVAELEFCVTNSGAKVVFLESDYQGMIPDLERAGVRHFVLIDGEVGGATTLDGLVAKSSAADDRQRRNDDLAGIFYTAGTTGNPKGVMLSHGNLLANIFNLLYFFRLDQDTRLLHATPMFHVAGAFNLFAPTVVTGQHYFLPKFEATQVLEEIERSRITFVAVVPTMLNMLIDVPNFSQRDLSSLKELFYGGSPIPESALQRALTMLPHVRLNQGFGLTETSPTVTFLSYEDHIRNGVISPKHRSAGRPVATVQVRLVDEQDEEVSQGDLGEICVAGNTVMKGYWNNRGETEKALRGGWLHTGDLGRFDDEGYLYIVDRLKDMIITGGENVFSIEIENVLSMHAAVLECGVVGIPSERWGEQVHAVVRLHEGQHATEEELIAHCRQHLSAFKIPRSIDLRDTPLPRSGANKLLKKVLRDELRQAR